MLKCQSLGPENHSICGPALTSLTDLGAGLPRGHGHPTSGGFGGIARWGRSAGEQSLVPRSPSQRIPVILQFRHLCLPGDIWQCLESILISSFQSSADDVLHLGNRVQRCRTQARPRGRVPSSPQMPTALKMGDSVRSQIHGEFSDTAPVMCESDREWITADQSGEHSGCSR